MKYGARNQLKARITKIKRGGVMSQVKLEILGPASMSSVMTIESLEELAVKEGDEVNVIVKAVNVLVTTD